MLFFGDANLSKHLILRERIGVSFLQIVATGIFFIPIHEES